MLKFGPTNINFIKERTCVAQQAVPLAVGLPVGLCIYPKTRFLYFTEKIIDTSVLVEIS